MSSNILLGSFIGDALALGPHWIYDPKEIHHKLGRITTYQAPLAIYHAGKTAGDLTHYGDQTEVLLRSIAEQGGFDLSHFASAWRSFWENPATGSYRDSATKATLAHLQSGSDPAAAGSSSREMAGAARIGPLFLLKWENDDALLAAVRAQTAFTHGDSEVLDAADFFARVVLAVQRGASIPLALEQTMALGIWKALPEDWLDNAIESAASSESDAAELHRHGLFCSTADAFPGICHLLLRYPETPATALIENINAGGDSAARGMMLGLVYGARFPVSTWPAEWLTGLRARAAIEALIRQLP